MSRYIQLKQSGELKKIRQFRNLTPEQELERYEAIQLENFNRRSARANATVRLINAHSAEHRALVRNEAHWLRHDRKYARNDLRRQTEASRRATIVLQYDHSYEWSKYYSQELHSLKSGFRSYSDHVKTARLTAVETKTFRYSLVAAAIAIFTFGLNFIVSPFNGDPVEIVSPDGSDSDPAFSRSWCAFQVTWIVSALNLSVDTIDISCVSGSSISAMSDSMPPVRNDHGGERKDVPSDPTKRCPEFEDMFRKYGMYPIETWSYIAWRESRCNPNSQNAEWDENGNMTYHLNKNKTYDTGLLQINSSWKSVIEDVCGKSATENYMSGLKNPDCNIQVARYIMEHSASGLGNWRM